MIQYGVTNFTPSGVLLPLVSTNIMNAITEDSNHIYLLTPLSSGIANRNQLLQFSKSDYSLIASYSDIRHEITPPAYASTATMTCDGVDLVYSMTYSPPAGHPNPPPLNFVFIRTVANLSAVSMIDTSNYGYAEAYSSCIHNRKIYVTTRYAPHVIVINADNYNDYEIIIKAEWTGSRKIKIFRNKIFITAAIAANIANLFVYDLNWNLQATYTGLGNNINEPWEVWPGYVAIAIPGTGVLWVNAETLRESRTSVFIDRASIPGRILSMGGAGTGLVRALYGAKFSPAPGHILHYNSVILS